VRESAGWARRTVLLNASRGILLLVKASRRSRTNVPFTAPLGLRAAEFSLGGDRFAVLSFPLTPPAVPKSFSAAEREVAHALLEDRTNAEIAAVRGTSVRTVANQVAAIFLKTGVRSRSELLAALGRLQRS
jgi:DNA-binding CsgD family transcriptional regulator